MFTPEQCETKLRVREFAFYVDESRCVRELVGTGVSEGVAQGTSRS